jgi:hypothetical protein
VATTILLAVAAMLVSDPCVGQEQPPPPGVPMGPWLVAPLIVSGYTYESNPFFRADEFDPASERILEIGPEIVATLPFRNSRLSLEGRYTSYEYENRATGDDDALDLSADLDLAFYSGDRLRIGYGVLDGTSRTLAFDEGGESVFNGEPYRFDRYSLEMSRAVAGRRGYEVSVRNSSVEFDEDLGTFFEFDGWETDVEYREPVSGYAWLLARYAGRRFDQFRSGDSRDAPFQKESTDAGFVGVRGVRQELSYEVAVGWARSEYEWTEETTPGGPPRSDFRGAVWNASVTRRLGPRDEVLVRTERRAFSSFFRDNNYYLSTRTKAQWTRRLRGRSSVWLSAEYATNDYPDPVDANGDGEPDVLREDHLWDIGIYGTVAVWRKLGFRVDVRHRSRDSNFVFETTDGVLSSADYKGLRAFVGVTLGWI